MSVGQVFEAQQRLIDEMEFKGIVLAGLSEEELRQHPHGQNSIIWVVWHAARGQDVLANAWVGGNEQVLDRDGFEARTKAGTRRLGTGMTTEEARALSDQVDVGEVLAYWDAVLESSIEVFGGLDDAALDTAVEDAARIASTRDGLYDNPAAMYLNGLLANRTRRWYATFLPIHTSEHLIGEALTIRSLLGRPTGI